MNHSALFPEEDFRPTEFNLSVSEESLFYDPGAFLMNAVLRKSAEKGISCYVTGFGGDDVFSPHKFYLADLIANKRWSALWQNLGHGRFITITGIQELIQSGILPLVPRKLVGLERKLFPRKPPVWIETAFAKKTDLMNKMAHRYAAGEVWFPDAARRGLYRRLFTWGGYARSLEQAQRLGQKFGVSFSYPLLDLDLVEFAFELPPHLLRWKAQNKIILRQAAEKFVPKSLQWRITTQDISPAAARALKHHEKLIAKWLDESYLSKMGITNPFEIKREFDRLENVFESDLLLSYLNTERWLRIIESAG